MTYDEHLKNANRSNLRKSRSPDLSFRARFSASSPLLKSPIFRENRPSRQRSTASLAVEPAGTLPADYVGFPTLPGLPPASPIYIPQTGGFEIT
jgi:hypothetical protein